MPSRITPLDVKAYASQEIYRKGEQIFEEGLVQNRFQTSYGLQATIRGKGNYRVEMIIDGEQLFGRCNCAMGSSHCEHQIAILLSWLNESKSFISYQQLRKAIREKDKNTLVDILLNLIEVFPELSQFFVRPVEMEEAKAVREDVANIFDFPHTQKIDPQKIVDACQILFVRAKILKNEGRWLLARLVFFEILNRTLSLVDSQQITGSFRENFIAELADDYEEITLLDPDFDVNEEKVKTEVKEILAHNSAELEGVFLDQLRQELNLS